MYNERDEAFHLVDLHPPLTIRASQGVYLEDLLNEPMAHFPGIGWMIPPTTGCRKSTHRRFPFSAYPGGRDLVGSMTAYGRKHSSASKDFFPHLWSEVSASTAVAVPCSARLRISERRSKPKMPHRLKADYEPSPRLSNTICGVAIVEAPAMVNSSKD
jgi:hypothetical protein